MRSPVSKPRPQSSNTPYKAKQTQESEELFSVESVGGLLSEMSISSATSGPRSSPSKLAPQSHSPSYRGRPTTPKHYGNHQHSESAGRGQSRTPFRGGFDASSPSSLRPVHTMISAGGISTNKVSIYVNASKCKLDTKRLSELLKFLVAQHITPYKDASTGAQTKKLRIIKFDLSSNILDDDSIAKLVGFFRQHASYLTVNSLKLYQNKIGDIGTEALAALIEREDGPTLHELHLSHNRITTRGALALCKSLADCPRYPFSTTQEKKSTPLWLRLEHNFISAEKVLEVLADTPTCQVNSKGSACTPSNCQNAGAKVHLVFIHFQYWNEALESAKRAIELLKDSTPSEEVTTETEAPAPAEPSSSAAELLQKPVSAVVGSTPSVKKTQQIKAGPLYLFMDTNAVVTSVLEPQHPWSFKNLAKRFGKSALADAKPERANENRSKHKGGAPAPSPIEAANRVVLVVTDTVLGELDGMHKKKIIKASIVNSMLMEAEKDDYLMMLGAHQGEKLVQALDVGHSQLGLDVTTSNDRMIVDIALMFADALGDTNCVMFISEDHGARLAARNRGLCVVSMSQLQVILAKRANDVWSSSLLRHWFLQAAPTKPLLEGSELPAPGMPAARPSNPISQLRVLKSHTIKAREIADSLIPASMEMEEKQAELSSILKEMENMLKRITLLPGLEGINGPPIHLNLDSELISKPELDGQSHETPRTPVAESVVTPPSTPLHTILAPRYSTHPPVSSAPPTPLSSSDVPVSSAPPTPIHFDDTPVCSAPPTPIHFDETPVCSAPPTPLFSSETPVCSAPPTPVHFDETPVCSAPPSPLFSSETPVCSALPTPDHGNTPR